MPIPATLLQPDRDWQFDVPHLTARLAVRSWRPAGEMSATSGPETAADPFIALHGWMDNAATFEALLPLVNARSACHALDFSGHGLSAHRSSGSDYYIWSYVEEVHALMETLGLQRCRLIGHSLGGGVATLFAALYPERVSAVVLLDAGGPLAREAEALPGQMRQAFADKRRIHQRQLRYYKTHEAALSARASRGIELDSAALLGARGIAHCEQGYYWSVDRQLQRLSPLSLTEAQVRTLLACIEAPVLLLASAEVLSENPWFDEARLDSIRRLYLHRLAGNHFQHLEGAVPEVAGHINDFLAEVAQQD